MKPPGDAGTQRGGFALGLIVGLLLGLVLALGVALYVTKVPIPFVNKVPQRTAEQDAAEAERNKNWDPNAPLSGRSGGRGAAASGAVQAASAATVAGSAPSATASAPEGATTPAAAASRPGRDPAAILSGASPGTPAASAPGGRPTGPGGDTFIYFVQAGAYSRADDAETQRARLAMLGFAAKVLEREQSGRTVYRVRLGPFDLRDEADGVIGRLQAASVDAALVRVERQ